MSWSSTSAPTIMANIVVCHRTKVVRIMSSKTNCEGNVWIYHGWAVCLYLCTWIKSWYHSKFQLILAKFSPLIPNLCSDKSESWGRWILISHWLISSIWRILNEWEIRIYFPPLSDLSEHSFGISGPKIARILLALTSVLSLGFMSVQTLPPSLLKLTTFCKN